MRYEELLTDERRARVESVVAGRSRTTVAVIEAFHDPHNIAAVVRTAEALGVQEVHVVSDGPFRAHRKISTRAEKWLDVVVHENIADAVASLRARGYRLYAAHPAEGGATLYQIDFRKKTALVFGHEHAGVSLEARALCDGTFTIPMTGFTRSLNLSVAAAICLSHAVYARGLRGDLESSDRAQLHARFAKLAVRQHKRVSAALNKEPAPAVKARRTA